MNARIILKVVLTVGNRKDIEMLKLCVVNSPTILLSFLLVSLASCSNDSPDFVFNANTDELADANTDELTDTNTDELTDTNTDELTDTNTDEPKDATPVRFTKVANADWRLVENQDQITPNVWLTRANQGLLFNARIEDRSNGAGPSGTKWFLGKLEDYEEEQLFTLEFESLKNAAGSRMKDTPGKTFIVHLVEDNVFIELTFHAWGNKSEGAGFSYSRTNVAN